MIIFFKYWSFENGLDINTCFGVELIQLLCVMTCALMLYELARDPDLRLVLWVHHTATMFIVLTLGTKIPYTSDKAFRNDPYYVEILTSVCLAGSLVFLPHLGWAYLYLLSFDKDTIIKINRMKTDYLKEIELAQQESIRDIVMTLQGSVGFGHAYGDKKTRGNINHNTRKRDELRMEAINSIFNEMEDDNGKDDGKEDENEDIEDGLNNMELKLNYENLEMNYESSKIQFEIVRFRLWVMSFLGPVMMITIPTVLFLFRLLRNDYYAIETKAFLMILTPVFYHPCTKNRLQQKNEKEVLQMFSTLPFCFQVFNN